MVIAGYRRIAGLLSRTPDTALLVVRVVLGGLMLLHGLNKFRAPGGVPGFQHVLTTMPNVPFPGITGVILPWVELLGGAMLVIGALARVAAIVLAGEMAIIAVLVKFADMHAGLITTGKGSSAEEEFLYIAGLLVVFLLGPGRLSVDALARLETRAPVTDHRPRASQPTTSLPG